jgi:hypothetical protein
VRTRALALATFTATCDDAPITGAARPAATGVIELVCDGVLAVAPGSA